ncbi:hypothetical protein CCGE531_26270 (plasmid) [Rhizobium sp. CCGE531]|nr:hypothetical protein CCGE531_26270 [Rhizobium sp. CCGE531]AYG75891.1 hypothetical protein CCGE532_25775 [Rhizobium sp. CCGE532]
MWGSHYHIDDGVTVIARFVPVAVANYDFNDDGLIHGARFHAAIVRRRLARNGQGAPADPRKG